MLTLFLFIMMVGCPFVFFIAIFKDGFDKNRNFPGL